MSMDWNTYSNLAASGDARAWAKQAADQAYNESLSRNGDRAQALAEAKFEWQKTMDRAGLTGKFEDNWTMPTQQWFTGQFGTWMPNGPQEGQKTMALQGQEFGQGQDMSSLFGQYYAPGTAPEQGTKTLAGQNQAFGQGIQQGQLTGWYVDPATGERVQTLAGQNQQFGQGMQTQQEARAAQGQVQNQAMDYLKLLSSLRGPADWAKYQQVLGSTPNGMRDLVGAAMGQYVPGGGATTGMQPQAANLTTMMQQVQGQPVTWTGQGSVPQGQLYTPSPYTGGQAAYYQQQPQTVAAYQQAVGQAYQQAPQAQTQQWNVQPQQQAGQAGQNYWGQPYQPQYQQAQQQQPQQTWGSGIGVGQQQPTPQQQQQGLGNGTNLPAPNQISAQGWRNMAPSQQQMLLGMYESQGWDKNDVQSLYNQSLPKYASNSAATGSWKM